MPELPDKTPHSMKIAHQIDMDKERLHICKICGLISLAGIIIFPILPSFLPSTANYVNTVLEILKAFLYLTFGYIVGSISKIS